MVNFQKAAVIRVGNPGIILFIREPSARAEKILMRLAGYLTFVLSFVLGMYILRICVRDFRRTRGSGTAKRYLYALGILLSVGLIVLAVIGTFLTVVGPLH